MLRLGALSQRAGHPITSSSSWSRSRWSSRRMAQQGAGFAASSAATAAAAGGEPEFLVLEERQLHQRYLTLYSRSVQFPDGSCHEFDVIGHPQARFHFSVVFPFHSATKTVTLVREYAQGPNTRLYCLPAGAFDQAKHVDFMACARAELSEEAHLKGGRWTPLVDEGGPGVAEVKWCANRFHSYLCVDPDPDPQPGARDKEEYIEIVQVDLPRLRALLRSGEFLLPSVATSYWALEELQLQGLL